MVPRIGNAMELLSLGRDGFTSLKRAKLIFVKSRQEYPRPWAYNLRVRYGLVGFDINRVLSGSVKFEA